MSGGVKSGAVRVLAVLLALFVIAASASAAWTTATAKLRIVEPKMGKPYEPGKIKVRAVVYSKDRLPPAFAEIYLDGKLVKKVPAKPGRTFAWIGTYVEAREPGWHTLVIKVKRAPGMVGYGPSVIAESGVRFFVKPYTEPSRCGKCGDVNCDGKVNMGDVTALYYHVAYGTPICSKWAGDVNGDSRIDIGDVIVLLYHIGYGTPLHCRPCS